MLPLLTASPQDCISFLALIISHWLACAPNTAYLWGSIRHSLSSLDSLPCSCTQIYMYLKKRCSLVMHPSIQEMRSLVTESLFFCVLLSYSISVHSQEFDAADVWFWYEPVHRIWVTVVQILIYRLHAAKRTDACNSLSSLRPAVDKSQHHRTPPYCHILSL